MYNCFFVFVLIDLSFEKMPRKFVELQIKMLHIYKWLVCFGLCCKVRMRTFPFSILFDWKKKDYFKNIKLWIFFFTTKMHWKSSKKKQKKTMILGWAFVIGRDRKKKKYCQIGAFFFIFFTSHLYSNHSLNLIILWFILFSFFVLIDAMRRA